MNCKGQRHETWEACATQAVIINKLGGAWIRYGDNCCVNVANLPYVGGCYQQTKDMPDLTPKSVSRSQIMRNDERGTGQEVTRSRGFHGSYALKRTNQNNQTKLHCQISKSDRNFPNKIHATFPGNFLFDKHTSITNLANTALCSEHVCQPNALTHR